MIDLIFYHGTEIIFIRIEGPNVKFSTSYQSQIWAPIDGLKLDYLGVIKEFPELEDDPEWQKEAIFRLKCKLKDYKNEGEIVGYVKEELEKFGYILKRKLRHGFRSEAIK